MHLPNLAYGGLGHQHLLDLGSLGPENCKRRKKRRILGLMEGEKARKALGRVGEKKLSSSLLLLSLVWTWYALASILPSTFCVFAALTLNSARKRTY